MPNPHLRIIAILLAPFLVANPELAPLSYGASPIYKIESSASFATEALSGRDRQTPHSFTGLISAEQNRLPFQHATALVMLQGVPRSSDRPAKMSFSPEQREAFRSRVDYIADQFMREMDQAQRDGVVNAVKFERTGGGSNLVRRIVKGVVIVGVTVILILTSRKSLKTLFEHSRYMNRRSAVSLILRGVLAGVLYAYLPGWTISWIFPIKNAVYTENGEITFDVDYLAKAGTDDQFFMYCDHYLLHIFGSSKFFKVPKTLFLIRGYELLLTLQRGGADAYRNAVRFRGIDPESAMSIFYWSLIAMDGIKDAEQAEMWIRSLVESQKGPVDESVEGDNGENKTSAANWEYAVGLAGIAWRTAFGNPESALLYMRLRGMDVPPAEAQRQVDNHLKDIQWELFQPDFVQLMIDAAAHTREHTITHPSQEPKGKTPAKLFQDLWGPLGPRPGAAAFGKGYSREQVKEILQPFDEKVDYTLVRHENHGNVGYIHYKMLKGEWRMLSQAVALTFRHYEEKRDWKAMAQLEGREFRFVDIDRPWQGVMKWRDLLLSYESDRKFLGGHGDAVAYLPHALIARLMEIHEVAVRMDWPEQRDLAQEIIAHLIHHEAEHVSRGDPEWEDEAEIDALVGALDRLFTRYQAAREVLRTSLRPRPSNIERAMNILYDLRPRYKAGSMEDQTVRKWLSGELALEPALTILGTDLDDINLVALKQVAMYGMDEGGYMAMTFHLAESDYNPRGMVINWIRQSLRNAISPAQAVSIAKEAWLSRRYKAAVIFLWEEVVQLAFPSGDLSYGGLLQQVLPKFGIGLPMQVSLFLRRKMIADYSDSPLPGDVIEIRPAVSRHTGQDAA